MSFSDMKQRSKTNLASLIKETEKISNPKTFGDTDDVTGVQSWTSQVMVTLLSDFYQHQKVKTCRGRESGIMDFRGPVAGTSKTL